MDLPQKLTSNDAQAPGNTNTSACLRSRAFQFTLNEVDKYKGLYDYLTSLKSLDYIISCKETAPSTGHEHIHIYAHFKTSFRLSLAKCYNAHVEICKGSPKQNIEYIRKDGLILDEYGTIPHQGICTIAELHDCDVANVNPHLYRIKKEVDEDYNKTELFMGMLDEIEHNELKGPEVIYYTGESGCGKTYSCYQYALSKFDKSKIGKITINNNFLSIINANANCFVIEEFRSSQMKASNFLQMIDKYGYDAPVKGGHVYIRPKCFIIASIIQPDELYNDEEINEQFLRRITHAYKWDEYDKCFKEFNYK